MRYFSTSDAIAAGPAGTAVGAGVRICGVTRIFPGGLVAVDGISLDIAPGSFVAILGPSGCGKTTLLRLIAGLDRQQSGTIELLKQRPARIAYVFQDATLLPWRNNLRNVALPLELTGIAKRERLDQAAEALDAVGLAGTGRMYPAQLSGGMRMRVSLARAMVTAPDLLLLDEPFAAVDEITRQHLDEQLRTVWARNRTTVIFVTHSTAEAAFLAERAIVMSRRPARIVLDTAIDLPSQRPASLRGEPSFAAQTGALFAALVAGGA
jgi:NitT/TauT family transport system ATP-binding protein